MNRQDQKKHQQALKLLEKDVLTYDEKYFILENFHEAGSCNNRVNGAHFTPLGLANDFSLEIGYQRVIDLCAGIGVLSFIYYHLYGHDKKPEIVCIELNPFGLSRYGLDGFIPKCYCLATRRSLWNCLEYSPVFPIRKPALNI